MKSEFVGKKEFYVIKMHGTTIKKKREREKENILHELLKTLTPAMGNLTECGGEYMVSPHPERSQN